MFDVGSCGKLQQSADPNENSLLKGKRIREYERVLHSEQERFLSDFKITLKQKPGELFKVNVRLREDSLKLKSKWTGKVLREQIPDMATANGALSCKPMASQAQIEKPKNIRIISNEEQTLYGLLVSDGDR